MKKGVIIYSHYVTGVISKVRKFIEDQGFSVGTYTGEEDGSTRNSCKEEFVKGEIDILIGSKPISTGVDKLQEVCNRMIILILPWTDAEYEQLKSRIYRQGSKFGDVEIIIPQVKIKLNAEEYWSWDIEKLNLIKKKRSLADVVIDGVVPKIKSFNRKTLLKKSIENLEKWKKRVLDGKVVQYERSPLNIDLYPDICEKDRLRRIKSELSEFNRKGKITYSKKMHKKFSNDKKSWYRYHALRKKSIDKWSEFPYEIIATNINDSNDVIADFGCGENLFKKCPSVKNNKVYSFDHVAIDDTVIACDMKDTGFPDNSIDVAVFSLSLWGCNHLDYLKEAYRLLRRKGIVYIAEPLSSYDDDKINALIKSIQKIGFKEIGKVDKRGKFVYFSFIKI